MKAPYHQWPNRETGHTVTDTQTNALSDTDKQMSHPHRQNVSSVRKAFGIIVISFDKCVFYLRAFYSDELEVNNSNNSKIKFVGYFFRT